MITEDAWSRLTAWCERHAPATFGHLRPPAAPAVRTTAEGAFARRWPEDLRAWYAVQDGAGRASVGSPLPDWRPLPIAEMRVVREMFVDVADHVAVDDTEAEPAGTFAFAFGHSFVPIADNGVGCYLFVDCRAGERSGCVMEWDRDELATREPRWASVTQMLSEVAASVENGLPCGLWRPTVAGGELVWELDATQQALDPWRHAWDVYMKFKSALWDRGDPFYRPPVVAAGWDWSNFEFDVVENVLSNAVYNRVPVQDWPPEQLAQVRHDFTALRTALPLFSEADRPYFALMHELWQATLAASRHTQ